MRSLLLCFFLLGCTESFLLKTDASTPTLEEDAGEELARDADAGFLYESAYAQVCEHPEMLPGFALDDYSTFECPTGGSIFVMREIHITNHRETACWEVNLNIWLSCQEASQYFDYRLEYIEEYDHYAFSTSGCSSPCTGMEAACTLSLSRTDSTVRVSCNYGMGTIDTVTYSSR